MLSFWKPEKQGYTIVPMQITLPSSWDTQTGYMLFWTMNYTIFWETQWSEGDYLEPKLDIIHLNSYLWY